MITSRNTNMDRMTGLDRLAADRNAVETTDTNPTFKAPRTRKVMCTRGTAQLRYGHRRGGRRS